MISGISLLKSGSIGSSIDGVACLLVMLVKFLLLESEAWC